MTAMLVGPSALETSGKSNGDKFLSHNHIPLHSSVSNVASVIVRMAGIRVHIPGMEGDEPSRLINGVANLTEVLQQAIPQLTRSFVETLDTVTNIFRPHGNVTDEDIEEISEQSILHLQKMTQGTVKLLDTLNEGLTPMQDISLGLVDLLETTNKTIQVTTLVILVLAVLAFVFCFALVGMCGIYYACYYKKDNFESVNSKQGVEYVRDKI